MSATPKVQDVSELLDISSLLSEEEIGIQKTVRAFVDDRVRPNIATWYDQGVFPRELVGELGAIGLLGMTLEGYGCAALNATSGGLVCLELEAGDSSFRSFVSVQGSLAMTAIYNCGSNDQKNEWLDRMRTGEAIGCFGLTEADSGSDPSNMRTRAKRDGSDWILTGSKMWITSGSIADVAIVWARTDDGITSFLVPKRTPGFEANEIHQKLSLRASNTAELVFDDVRLPSDARLEGATGLGAALRCLNEARFGIVFGALGAAPDCLQVARDYAINRIQFDKPIGSFQLTQKKLTDMSLELAKGLLVAVQLGRLKEAGKLTHHAVSAGKLNSTRESIKIARSCRTILGAAGISQEFPLLRHANNLESVLTYEGTEEVHTLVVGEALTGLAAYR